MVQVEDRVQDSQVNVLWSCVEVGAARAVVPVPLSIGLRSVSDALCPVLWERAWGHQQRVAMKCQTTPYAGHSAESCEPVSRLSDFPV